MTKVMLMIFLNRNLLTKKFVELAYPWNLEIIDRTLFLTGGALEATIYAIKNGGITGVMAGGTHHAHRDFGSGYCVFNDLAICAKYVLEKMEIQRVAILDFDVHQGDGTATILANEPRVRVRFQFTVRKIFLSENQ